MVKGRPWSKEDIEQLWTGDSHKVIAERIGRTPYAVEKARKRYRNLRPTAGANTDAPVATSKQSGIKRKKKRTARTWTVDELNQLWTAPGKKLARQLKRTVQAVYLKRLEFLKNNPEFNPPKEARWTHKPKTAPVSKLDDRAPLKEPVTTLPKSNGTFKMSFGGKELTLPQQPKRIKLGDIELEF